MSTNDPLQPHLHKNRKGQPKRAADMPTPASDQSDYQNYEVAAMIARALGDAPTLRILQQISLGHRTASDLVQYVDLPLGLIDNRIFKLRRVGVLQQVGIPPKAHSVLRSADAVAIVTLLLNFAAWVKEFLPSKENDQRLRDILGPVPKQE